MEIDKKIESFAYLMNCELNDDKIIKNNQIVGSIEEKTFDLKDANKLKITQGNTRYHQITNDASDIVNGVIISYNDGIMNFKTINTLDAKLEFSSLYFYDKMYLEVGTDEVKIKINSRNTFVEFHLMKRQTDNKVLECCNLRFGPYVLYYKNDQSIFSNNCHESIYFSELIYEEASGVSLSLVENLNRPEIQQAINAIKTELDIVFGENFFNRLVGTVLTDYDLFHDFSFLNKSVILSHKQN